MTAVYAGLEQRRGGLRVRISAAGHPPGLLRTPGGQVEVVQAPGMVLGLFDHPDLAERRYDMAPGCALVLVTDGVLEARRGTDQYGDDRLAALLAGLPDDLSASGIAAAVERAALDFGGHEPSDDTAVLVVRVPVAV